MDKRAELSYEIQYTKAADKFLKTHEDVRTQYEDAIKELLIGDHPDKIDVKRIKGKRNDYYRIKLGGLQSCVCHHQWENHSDQHTTGRSTR